MNKKLVVAAGLAFALSNVAVAQAYADPKVEKSDDRITSTVEQAPKDKLSRSGWEAPASGARITSTSKQVNLAPIEQQVALTSTDAGTVITVSCYGEPVQVRTYDDGGKDTRALSMLERVPAKPFKAAVSKVYGIEAEDATLLSSSAEGLLLPDMRLDTAESKLDALHKVFPACGPDMRLEVPQSEDSDTESSTSTDDSNSSGPGSKGWDELPVWGK